MARKKNIDLNLRINNIKFMEKALLKMSKQLKYLIDCRRNNKIQCSVKELYLSGERMRLICFST